MSAGVAIHTAGRVTTVTIRRVSRRNAVDLETGRALLAAFKAFDADDRSDVAILAGEGGTFCAGADLQALAAGERKPVEPDGDFAPMGPTRLRLSKPVIAAIEGHAVAGGMELALWCDLRVAGRSAVMGIFNRRFGVPLVDLGTIRLPQLIGQGRALELILTGRPVAMDEALAIGLVTRVVDDGSAQAEATALAKRWWAFHKPDCATIGSRCWSTTGWTTRAPSPTRYAEGSQPFAAVKRWPVRAAFRLEPAGTASLTGDCLVRGDGASLVRVFRGSNGSTNAFHH